MRQNIVHPLMPIYNANSKILILGTMPSPASRHKAFYYAHLQNRFWPLLFTLFNLPCLSDNDDRRAFCLSHGIALWDVLQSCTIEGASDSSIRDAVPNDLTQILSVANIRAIFTTGKSAEKFYRLLSEPSTGITAIALPSPSAANAAMRFDTLLDCYRSIMHYLA